MGRAGYTCPEQSDCEDNHDHPSCNQIRPGTVAVLAHEPRPVNQQKHEREHKRQQGFRWRFGK